MSHYDKKEKSALAVYASIFLLLVLGIAVGGHVSYRNFEEEFRRQAEKQVSAIAELKASQLADWRQERLIDAHSFYHNPVFSALVQRYFENPADVETRKQIISNMEYYQSYAGYDGLSLLDGKGSHRLVVPANSEEFKQAEMLLMTQAAASLDSGDIFFGDFQRDSNTDGKTYISILIPLFADQSDGHPLGVLILYVNPEIYLYPYISHWPIPSDTAETLLVRRDGEDVLFLNELRFTQDAALNLRFPLTDSHLPAVKAVLGQTGLVEGRDYRGKLVLADVRPVPDSPWFIVSKVDIDEVYAPLRERLWQTLLIVGLAILVAGAGLALVWRQQRVLFYRTQAEAAGTLRESEEKFRKAFILTPDSININRLSDGMYVSINNGFTKIMGYTPDEVIGKTSLELDIWVDSQDRKTLVDGLMKNGEVENLESCFRAKNGDIKYGLMSASVLELNGIPHIISITRDVTGRKQAEDAMRENEENLSITLHSIGDGVITTDKDGLIVNMNPMAEKYCDWTLKDAKGKPLTTVFNIIDAETREKVADPIAKVMLSGQIVGLANHTVLISKNGVEYQIADSAAPIKDKNGGIIGVVLVFSDVTEKYNATAKLRESEANFSDIFQTVSEGIVYATLSGEVLSINNSLEKILEIPRERIIGKNILSLVKDLLSGENIKKVLPVIVRLTHGKEIQPFEVEYKNKLLEVAASINRNSGRLTGVIRDITERNQAEERLEQFFSINLDLLCITDLEGNFIKVNKAWEAILGYSVSEIEHRKFMEFVHPEDMDSTLAAVATLGKQEQVLNFVNRCRCLDGSYRFIEWRSQPSGNLIYAAARDITERKQAEESLRGSEEKLRSIFRVAPTGIGVVKDRVLYEVNARISEMTGYSKEELIGQSARILYPTQEEFEWVGSEKYKQISEKGSGVVETKWQKKDGSIIDVLLASTPIDLADISRGVTFTALDITERKRAEETLRITLAKYKTLFEYFPLGISVTDMAGNILETNPTAEKLLSVPLNEHVQRDIESPGWRIVRLDGTPMPTDEFASVRALREKRVVENVEMGILKPDDSITWLSVTAAPLPVDGHGVVITYGDVTARRKAEEALRDSEERFRTHYDNTTIGLYRTTPDGNIMMLNPAGVQMLGYDSFEELANRNLEDAGFGMQNSRRRFSEKLEREGVVRGLESQWNRKDGSIIFVRESAQVFRDGTGKILYYDGSFEDISTQVHAEAAWKESEKLYRKMNENSPLGMHFYNLQADNQLIFSGANPAANKLLGVDHSQFIEKTIEEAFPPLAQTEVPQRYRDAAANGIPWSTEQISYEDGQISGAFEVKAFQTTPGNMVAVFTDITARKQAEKALRESEAIYRRAIEVANAVPYRQSYHVNGNTVDYDFIGEGIRQITGYSPDEFNELVWDSLAQERILLDDLAEYSFDEAIQRVRSGVSPVWKCNHRICARDGKIHWVFEAAVELRDENGVSYGSIGMFQDITGRKQAEDQIRQFNMELEQRVRDRTVQLETTNKELEAFSYSVSHDLRAPLRGINGWSQALLEDYRDKLDEQGQQYIERVRSETQRMGHLIDDMLRLSRLARADMMKEQVDLSAIAQRVVERLKRDEPHRLVDFSIQAQIIAEGDPHLLESALENLLANAFKFTGKRTDARVEFGQTEIKDQRVFFVRDNGAGFNMTYAQKLFGPFQRMHKISEFPGTGIGLATVQRIIHRHGGRVWAEAEIERGATFYFTLD
jgi:PAS domain S-box-containing protein